MAGKARYIRLNLDPSSYFLFYTGTVLFVNSVWKSDCNCEIRIAAWLSEIIFCILKGCLVLSSSKRAIQGGASA